MIGFAALHERLAAAYGPQQWWPSDNAFEIMLGAILVQRTTWRNAARALEGLRAQSLLESAALAAADASRVEQLIRGAGFFRTKAARLRGVATFVREAGGTETFRNWPTEQLRETLLGMDGVGPETADTILLYAFGRPAVVVDEYLRRLVRRLNAEPGLRGDEEIRRAIIAELDDPPRLNEFHALVVEHGKRHCGSRPRCAGCPLRRRCHVGRKEAAA